MKLERYFENPKTFHIGCEENRAYYIPFGDSKSAMDLPREKSDRFISLNGEWKFKLYKNIYECENIALCIDYKQSGIGSNSCGPETNDIFKIKGEFELKVKLSGR